MFTSGAGMTASGEDFASLYSDVLAWRISSSEVRQAPAAGGL